MKLGYIRIKDNKIYFEPDGLEKPKQGDYCIPRNDCTFRFYRTKYGKALKEYEASKKSVEVNNVEKKFHPISKRKAVLLLEYKKLGKLFVYDNQPCKAEITGNTAEIIELTKQQ